jgi:hypothetical protein
MAEGYNWVVSWIGLGGASIAASQHSSLSARSVDYWTADKLLTQTLGGTYGGKFVPSSSAIYMPLRPSAEALDVPPRQFLRPSLVLSVTVPARGGAAASTTTR